MTKKNIFKKREIEAQILGDLYDSLVSRRKNACQEYVATGEQRQKTNWRTGELLWEDEEQTIPMMENVYGYRDIPMDSLSDDTKLEVEVIEELMKKLEKL